MTTDDLLLAWDQYSAAHLKPSTASLYRLFAKQLMDHAKVQRLRQLTRQHVEAWKLAALQTNSPRTVNNKLRQARSVVHWAIDYFGLDMPDPFAGVRKCREQKRTPRYLTEPQVLTLLREAANHSQDAHVGFALMIFAGLRKAEVAFARWEWVNWQRNTIFIQPVYINGACVWEPKNQGSINESPLHPRMRAILETYRQPRGWMLAPSKSVTSNYRYRYDWKRTFAVVAKRAGCGDISPHVLRHTLASIMAARGYSMRQIQAVLRHADARSTACYAHLEGRGVDISRVFG